MAITINCEILKKDLLQILNLAEHKISETLSILYDRERLDSTCYEQIDWHNTMESNIQKIKEELK